MLMHGAWGMGMCEAMRRPESSHTRLDASHTPGNPEPEGGRKPTTNHTPGAE